VEKHGDFFHINNYGNNAGTRPPRWRRHSDTTRIGTDAALAYERSVLASATSADTVAGEQVIRGPWTEYVRAR
jgi:hypothetical protein